MLIEVNAETRGREQNRLRRVQLDAGLSGGPGRVGIGSSGVLGLLARGIAFDVLLILSFHLRISDLGPENP
jgi:hypothetical protein